MHGTPRSSLFSVESISISISFAILRAIMHDPAAFPEPSRFHPERWLAPGAPVFPDVAFGFGRRECPGRFMARESVWSAIAGVLATFEISAVEDDPPKELFASGIVACVILSWNFALRVLCGELFLAILSHSSVWYALARRHLQHSCALRRMSLKVNGSQKSGVVLVNFCRPNIHVSQ